MSENQLSSKVLTAKIKSINFWKDGVVEIYAECPYCGNLNRHEPGESIKAIKDGFEFKIEENPRRCCDNHKCTQGIYKLFLT